MSKTREALAKVGDCLEGSRAGGATPETVAHIIGIVDAALAAPDESAELREALRPRLSKLARQRLEETAEAEEGCGDADVADAIRFLLEREDKIVALTKSGG